MDVLGLISIEEMNEVARRALAATTNRCAAVKHCNEQPNYFLNYFLKGNRVRKLACAEHAQQAAGESGRPSKPPSGAKYAAVAG